MEAELEWVAVTADRAPVQRHNRAEELLVTQQRSIT